jgi:uncharacterized protein (TIGR03437 family)
MKKRNSRFLPLSAVLLLTASIPAGRAQTGTLTTVLASPSGPWIEVDGTVYFNAMSAFWPVGSEHILSIPQGTGYSYGLNGDTQYQFQGWSWAGYSTSSTSVLVIADPSVTRYTAAFTVQYQLTVQVGCNPAPCPTDAFAGEITVNNQLPKNWTPIWSTWWPSGSSVALQAVPFNGWLFSGWQIGNNPLIKGDLYPAAMSGPLTATAVFVPAKDVNFITNPPNLSLYVDGTVIYTPSTLQWGLGTSHTVGGLDLTNDNTGKRWVFGSWSDGGAQTHTYVVGNNLSPETVTATYAAAAYPIFITSPPGLNLVIDGKVLPLPYSYIWGVGSTHTVSATTPQTDSQGNTWVFQSWDDLVTAPSRTITIPVGADVNGYRLTALYAQQATLNVNSTIAGQVVTVDGSPCTTPCSVLRKPGAQVHVSAPASVPVNGATRQDLLGWATGSAAPVPGDWAGALNTATTSITATYRLMNSLTTSASPPRGATWRISPASPDGFYDSGTKVDIRVAARPGYRFSSWSGDLSGSTPSGTLTMNVPHSVTAQFTTAPIIGRGGVSNGAAMGTPVGVAPGSVASIFGDNLTAETVVGPATPLAKSLAGVTVHIGTRSLPLYFVSPAQINFEIPPDLAPGVLTVVVSSAGMPDVSSDFTVVRNAPGLFPAVIDGQTYAMVMHEDGTPVTAAAPARQGELLTAYGTGFGPTDRVRPEGVALAGSPRYMILDPVTIQLGAGVFKPESAFASPGQVGVDAIQFRLDSSATSGAAIPLYLTVNGVSSNTLPLPIQ